MVMEEFQKQMTKQGYPADSPVFVAVVNATAAIAKSCKEVCPAASCSLHRQGRSGRGIHSYCMGQYCAAHGLFYRLTAPKEQWITPN